MQDELKNAMEMMGENLDDAELDQLIALADVDKDGQIDFSGKRHLKLTSEERS